MKTIYLFFAALLFLGSCTFPKKVFDSSDAIVFDSKDPIPAEAMYMKSGYTTRIAITKDYIKIDEVQYPVRKVKKYALVDDAWIFYTKEHLFIYKQSLKLDQCDLARNVQITYPLSVWISGYHR
ncbi:hypothetical protein [Marinoscillum sp. MHG1-6]|uniref:hypothetical protein n=1 Tax=Marinoscillum sp. MHG1-6 TaxID=2959627 RepID=UPI002158367E|nr:hypothetical protein [Marinoscillum sp. MHG1-6]